MKVTDLMVRDWIQVKRGFDGHLTNEKIKGLLDDDSEPYPIILTTEETVSLDGIVPIPLTEDILVKNGFEKKIYTSPSNNEDYRYYQWNPTPEYPDYGVWLWPDGDSYTYNSRISDIKINYVHQLQHLLRLCCIENEIEL